MPTGEQIGQRIIDERPLLGFRSLTTAVGGMGPPAYLVDAVKLRMNTRDPSEFGGAMLVITSGDVTNAGMIAGVDRIDPSTGRVYFSPAPGDVVASGAFYEIWKHGIDPAQQYKARDRALTLRCRHYRLKALSVLPDVEAWRDMTYSGASGGIVGVSALPTTLDFPTEYAQQSMVLSGSSSPNYISSPSYYCQPQETLRLFGVVSTRQGTSSLRLRDVVGTTDIPLLVASALFTLRGFIYFNALAVVPAGVGEVQLWLGGNGTSDVSEWAAVGMLPTRGERFTLPARVFQGSDVGRVFARTGAADPNVQSADMPELIEVPCERTRFGARVTLTFPSPPAASYGVYYEEGHHFAALQPGYERAAQHVTGLAATTDCELQYVAAATVSELLKSAPDGSELNKAFLTATADLEAYERAMGPRPMVVRGPSRSGRPRMLRV